MCPIAVPAPVSPLTLRLIVALYGYKELGQTEYNWIMLRDGADDPLILPKKGKFVSITVMDKMFAHTGMDLRAYTALKATVENGSVIQ